MINLEDCFFSLTRKFVVSFYLLIKNRLYILKQLRRQLYNYDFYVNISLSFFYYLYNCTNRNA